MVGSDSIKKIGFILSTFLLNSCVLKYRSPSISAPSNNVVQSEGCSPLSPLGGVIGNGMDNKAAATCSSLLLYESPYYGYWFFYDPRLAIDPTDHAKVVLRIPGNRSSMTFELGQFPLECFVGQTFEKPRTGDTQPLVVVEDGLAIWYGNYQSNNGPVSLDETYEMTTISGYTLRIVLSRYPDEDTSLFDDVLHSVDGVDTTCLEATNTVD